MKKIIILCALIGIINSAFGQKTINYPPASKDTTTNIYFGDEVSDPYQWMEDVNDPRLLNWLKKQKGLTKKISNRQVRKWELMVRLVSMYHDVDRDETYDYKKQGEESLSKYYFEKEFTNYKKSKNLLFKHRDQKDYKLLIKAKDYLKEKGDKLAYTSTIVNEENELVVVTLSINGSDWNTGYIFNLKNGKKLPYVLPNLKGFSPRWVGSTLYFVAFDAPVKGRALLDKGKGQKLYKLEVGKKLDPELIYTNQDSSGTNLFDFTIRDDKLFIYHQLKSRNTIYKAISYADLNATTFFLRSFLAYPNQAEIYLSIAHISNDSIWLNTNWDAPNGKVLLANFNSPNKLTEFVPQGDILLDKVRPLGKNKLALTYLHDGQNTALIYNYQGELLKRIDFPKGKKLNSFYETKDRSHANFTVSSFFHPDLWYQLSLKDLSFKPVERLTVPYDVSEIETKYVSYPSKDGTEISMYITCQKGLKLNGNNPVMLYGYGGYGTVVEPSYEEGIALFISLGGVFAVPNVRGGGAKGSSWAASGRRLNKQNSIDDFIGAAEYLIKEKYTRPEKIVSSGASHGGLLVTASMIQRPKLFKAVIAEAGPYDMLRFHKYTVGGITTNLLEFGTPENQEDYQNLSSYSPLHNIKEGVRYPNLLLLTGNSDDRVPPFHSYKFLASLQEKASDAGLYMLYLTKGAGHGGAITQEDFEKKLLFKYYFLFDTLGIDFY